MSGVLFCSKYLAMRIQCTTLFDCSATGTTGHLRMSELPFVDGAGNSVGSQLAWHRSRNQQRNWETLLQLISLRCQPIVVEGPEKNGTCWSFTFEVDAPGVFGEDQDFVALYNDCRGVPMVVGLAETDLASSVICVDGQDQNIWFRTINI